MHHVQLMRAAAPTFNANPDGGVYLITSSVAVKPPRLIRPDMRH